MHSAYNYFPILPKNGAIEIKMTDKGASIIDNSVKSGWLNEIGLYRHYANYQ